MTTREDIINRLPSPTIIRQAFTPSPTVKGGTRSAQIVSQADQIFFFQTYDIHPDGSTVLDHSEAWSTARGAESAWRNHGWDETRTTLAGRDADDLAAGRDPLTGDDWAGEDAPQYYNES